MLKNIKKLLRESLLTENNNFQILPFYEDVEYDEFGFDLDEYEVYNQAQEVAKSGGVTILSSKHLHSITLDVKQGRVIGAIWVSQDSSEFSFDIAIDPSFQNMGLATPLLDAAMEEYESQKEVHGDDLEIVIDVINPKLAEILQSKYGFEVGAHLSQDRVLMTLSENVEYWLRLLVSEQRERERDEQWRNNQ